MFRRPSGTAAAGQVCADLRNSRINLAHLARSVVQADVFGAPSRKQEVHGAGKTNHWLFMCSRGCCDNVGLSCWRSGPSVCWFLLLQCRSLPLCLCPSPFILLFSVFGFSLSPSPYRSSFICKNYPSTSPIPLKMDPGGVGMFQP